MKLVINRCWGGFGISMACLEKMRELGYKEKVPVYRNEPYYEGPRDNPYLVAAVVALGDEASGKYARLRIVDIPDDIKYTIHDYDGQESVHEAHRSW